MQVSQVQDHASHAVVGGRTAIDFGISSSAEFFNVLSSTLYKDQLLAVVREVLCNAWDIHIETGREATPIEITLTNEHFIVKDFGTGIHHEDIGPIYGVYGNSTKKHDGTQTGGFGLGCKAPFAYTDHFEVTSCHEGIKTIYQMSKAFVQNGGKPAIVPIASFPTTESGLTVKIDLKSPYDFSRLQTLIQRIVYCGEMNATLNGKKLETLGFDKTFMIYRGLMLSDTTHAISVRYGNVIYPIDYSHKDLLTKGREIEKFLEKLERVYARQFNILFQAPPHSLSVTPSRESLSMVEHTVKTIERIFDDFLTGLPQFTEACGELAQASVREAVSQKAYDRLLSRNAAFPMKYTNIPSADLIFTDYKKAAQHYVSHTYPDDLAFRKSDWKYRMNLMAQQNLLDRGLVSTWVREIDGIQKIQDNWRHDHTDWLLKRVIAPLVSKLSLDPDMDPKGLYVIDQMDSVARGTFFIIPAVKAKPKHHFYTASYLRNIIVLARRKNDVWDRAVQHPVFKQYGREQGFLFYHVGLSKKDADAARAFFAKTKMIVVDLIDRQSWDPTPVTTVRIPRKPTQKGLVTIGSLLDTHGVVDIFRAIKEDDPTIKRIDNPEYVLKVALTAKSEKNVLNFLTFHHAIAFAKLFGDRGCITNRQDKYEAALKKGALPFEDFLLKEVVDYVGKSKNIQKYWSLRPQLITGSKLIETLGYGKDRVFNKILKIPELADHFQVKFSLSETDENYLTLFERLRNFHKYRECIPKYQPLFTLEKQLSKTVVDPAIVSLIRKLNASKLIGLIDVGELEDTYNQIKKNKVQLDKFVEAIITLLNN